MNLRNSILLRFVLVYVFIIITGTVFFIYMDFEGLGKSVKDRYNNFIGINKEFVNSLDEIVYSASISFYNHLKTDTLIGDHEKIMYSFSYIENYPVDLATVFVEKDGKILFSNNSALLNSDVITEKYNFIQDLMAMSKLRNQYINIYKTYDSSLSYIASARYIKNLNIVVGVIKDDKDIRILIKNFREDQINDIHKQIWIEVPSFILLFSLVVLLLHVLVFKPLNKLRLIISKMNEGDFGVKIPKEEKKDTEIGILFKSYEKLLDALHKITEFAHQIGQGNLDTKFVPLSEKDELGKSLLTMRDNLKRAKEEEDKRKEEDAQRNWIATGLAKFSEILRQNNDNLEKLGDAIIQNLVHYVGAIQGGLFLYDENSEELHLLSAYAYNRKKFLQKTIKLGEGLVGTCAIEKEKIYITDVPNDYLSITSGLGGANPRNILLVPLKLEDNIFGVIELASFEIFEPHKIEFIEKVAENIASVINNVKINIKTKELLEQSKQQAEELATQEEEMRQNLEELQATQEEAARREQEIRKLLGTIDSLMLRLEISSNKKFILANENFLAVTGYTHGEIIDNEISVLDTDGKEFSTGVEKAFESDVYKGIIRIKSKAGEILFTYMSFYYKKDTDSLFVIGFEVTKEYMAYVGK